MIMLGTESNADVVLPEIRVVKADETLNCMDPFVLRHAKRIFGVYVYDYRLHVHCCEMTASYELHFIESQADYADDLPEKLRERLLDSLMEGDRETPPVCYMHVYHVDGFPLFRPDCLPSGPVGQYVLFKDTEPRDSDDPHEEAIEDAEEYARCNSV